MDRNSVTWRGYIPAITTPFNEHGDLDLPQVTRLVEWLVSEGMQGLVVAGTTGEWFSLSSHEKKVLFRQVSEAIRGEIPIIAGCNAFTAKEVVNNAAIAAECGFDGILVTLPPYVRPCEREIIAFYEDVNSGTPLPICVYNWPPGTNIDLRRGTLELLTELDMVVAIKNSTSNWAQFLDTMNALNGKVRIFGAPMTSVGAELILNGSADGTMGAGAVLGRAQPDFYNALWAGDLDRALSLSKLDQRIMSDWFRSDYTAKFGSAQAILKAALDLQGLPGGLPRRPILPLAENEIAMVRKTLEDLGRL